MINSYNILVNNNRIFDLQSSLCIIPGIILNKYFEKT